MTFPHHYFRSYDIRGRVTEAFTPELLRDIGRALGSEVREAGFTRIAVGRDGRLSSPELQQALTEGLTASGVDVLDVGMVPTPLLYYSAYTRGDGCGVMVTGSHNPPQDNGVKMVVGRRTLAGDQVQRLKQRILDQDYSSGEGEVTALDVKQTYLDEVAAKIELARPLRVVVDCGNGAGGELVPQLLRLIGCEVEELYCDVDGRFPHHHPDPSQPDNLADLIERVKSTSADIGLAFDGDADRLGVVDSSGNIIWPDRLLMLLALDLLLRKPGAGIVYDVKCSDHLRRLVEQAGGRPIIWSTGHSLMKARLGEDDADLAGELSGHIFIKEGWFGFDDALFTAARLLEIVAADPRPSAQLFATLPQAAYSTPELRAVVAEGEAPELIARLVEAAHGHFSGARITTIDGLRVDFDDGWGLVRGSNTTPCLTIRFEAESSEAKRRIEDEFRELLLQLKPEIELPF